MKLSDKLEVAKQFSAMMHADTGKVYGTHPYSYHLQQVVDVLLSFDVTDRDVLAAAYLHDILEDTQVNYAMLVEIFGETTAGYVFAVTDEPGVDRKERKTKTYPKIKASPVATKLKLADRIANVKFSIATKNERMFRMYRKEQPEFAQKVRELHDEPQWASDMWGHLEFLITTGLADIKTFRPDDL